MSNFLQDGATDEQYSTNQIEDEDDSICAQCGDEMDGGDGPVCEDCDRINVRDDQADRDYDASVGN